MSPQTPLSAPLIDLPPDERRGLLEYWLDYSRAADHAARLGRALPVDLAALIATCPSAAELARELAHIAIVPVLTSHPSEMRAPAALAALAESDDAATALKRLREAGGRVYVERPTVVDEVTTLLGHFERVIFDAIPDFYEELEAAARERFGDDAPAIPTLLRFHSWVGCDRDGNPECTAVATREAAARMHRCIVARYRDDLAAIAQAGGVAEIATACMRLHADLEPEGAAARISSEAFARELLALRAQTHSSEGARFLRRLERRFATFGFHLAALEWRQHSDFILLTFDERAHALHSARICESLAQNSSFADYEHLLTTPKASEVMHSLRALADIRRSYGAQAVGELIISNCEDTPVVLALERLARDAGVFTCGELPVVPLFESISALQQGPRIVAELLTEPAVRAKLARLSDRFEIMIGYSDAAKDGGRIGADILIAEAQRALVSACEPHGVVPLFFHGRGGSHGRGCAGFAEATSVVDSRLPPGEIKITEQGEVVANRYGHPRLAAHTLRSWFRELLLRVREDAAGGAPHDHALRKLEQRTARRGTEAFRALRESSAFMESVRSLTQLDLIRSFPLSSRPASRNAGRQSNIDLASLRAVPFNIAFNLTFAQLPAWFGSGTALAAELQCAGTPALRAAYRTNRVFRAAVDRARAALEATDLRLLSERGARTRESAFVAMAIAEEGRARAAIAEITGAAPRVFTGLREHPYLTETLRFLEAQHDDSDRYICYLGLATIAAVIGMTG